MESNLVIGTSFSCDESIIGPNDQSFIGPCNLLDNFDMNMTTNSLLLDASCEYSVCAFVYCYLVRFISSYSQYY